MNFHRRNLNLLVALDALIMDKSITRAAERLHLSQPAMSSVVSKLRDWLEDPLLVRGPSGYALTPRAKELAGPLRSILNEIDSLISTKEFDPLTSQRVFNIGMLDAAVMLPPLLKILQRDAPNIEVKVTSYVGFPEQALTYGELDVVIGNFKGLPDGFVADRLFEGYPVSVVRQDHPRIQHSLSVQQFLAEAHALALSEDSLYLAFARSMLASYDAPIRIAAHVSHFMEAAIIASQSDLIATVPNRLAAVCESALMLQVFKPPFDFPTFQVDQVWHERASIAPDHQWLRATLSKTFSAF